MRMFIKPFQLITSMMFVGFLILPQPVRADGGEDYYKELRKLKKFDPATLDRIKRSTVDAEQIKKVNALSKANFQHNSTVESQSKKETVTSDDSAAPATGPNGEKASAPRLSGKARTITPSTPSKTSAVTVKKETIKKPSSSSSPTSAPIKVNSDTPDELNFPGE